VERQAAEKLGKFSSRIAACKQRGSAMIFTFVNAESTRGALRPRRRSAFAYKALNQRSFARAVRTADWRQQSVVILSH
jgi:hypothetical protein